MLGVCERTFRRYIDRFEEAGLEELIDKRIDQVSSLRAPVDEVLALEALYRERYDRWATPTRWPPRQWAKYSARWRLSES